MESINKIGFDCYVSYSSESSKAKLVRPDTNTHIALTRTEYRLLRYLVDNASKPISLESMADHLWGADRRDTGSLKSLISHIRKKLVQLNPAFISSLVTNIGWGSYTYYIIGETASGSRK